GRFRMLIRALRWSQRGLTSKRERRDGRSSRPCARAHCEEVDLEGVALPRSTFFHWKRGAQLASPERNGGWLPDMKKIEAIIKPFKLEEVKSGLAELGIEGMTVTEVKGFPAAFVDQPTRSGLGAPRFLPKLKVELVVRNDLLGSAIAAIKECART